MFCRISKSQTPNSKKDLKYKAYNLKDYKQKFSKEIQKPLGGMGNYMLNNSKYL